MNELRRAMFDETGMPPDLSPELRFLAGRQASAAALLVDHAELYNRLLARFEQDGPSDELRAIALDAAGNLGTVLQSMRSREDLLRVLGRAPETVMFPSLLIDQLFYSFTLLATPGNENTDPPAHLSPDELGRLLHTTLVRDWLASVDDRGSLANPLTSRFAFEGDQDD